MAAPDPVLLAGIIQTNASVAQERAGATLDTRRVAFSYGVTLTSLPPEDYQGAYGPTERAEAVDTADARWQRGDLLVVQSFDGHEDATGNPVLPEIVTYLVTAARRLPGALPLMILTLTGQVATLD